MHAPRSATAISVGAESMRNMVPKDRPTAQAATTSCLGRGARRRTMPNRKPAVMDTAPEAIRTAPAKSGLFKSSESDTVAVSNRPRNDPAKA